MHGRGIAKLYFTDHFFLSDLGCLEQFGLPPQVYLAAMCWLSERFDGSSAHCTFGFYSYWGKLFRVQNNLLWTLTRNDELL